MGGDFFSFEVAKTREDRVFALRGELDVAHAEEVQLALTEAGDAAVIVDLSNLTFIDSSGLTALVHARNYLKGRGRAFEVRGANGNVRRVFEIAGLTKLLAPG